jgi:hypothetical protein
MKILFAIFCLLPLYLPFVAGNNALRGGEAEERPESIVSGKGAEDHLRSARHRQISSLASKVSSMNIVGDFPKKPKYAIYAVYTDPESTAKCPDYTATHDVQSVLSGVCYTSSYPDSGKPVTRSMKITCTDSGWKYKDFPTADCSGPASNRDYSGGSNDCFDREFDQKIQFLKCSSDPFYHDLKSWFSVVFYKEQKCHQKCDKKNIVAVEQLEANFCYSYPGGSYYYDFPNGFSSAEGIEDCSGQLTEADYSEYNCIYGFADGTDDDAFNYPIYKRDPWGVVNVPPIHQRFHQAYAKSICNSNVPAPGGPVSCVQQCADHCGAVVTANYKFFSYVPNTKQCLCATSCGARTTKNGATTYSMDN